MSDSVESMLENLSPGRSRPAPAFLRAVAKRRHRRQLTRAGIGAAALLAAAGLWWAAPPGAPTSGSSRVIAEAEFSAPQASLVALTRANAGSDVESLVLPEPAGSGPTPELRLGMRAERLEQWLSN